MLIADVEDQTQTALAFWESEEASAGTFLFRCNVPEKLCPRGIGGPVVATLKDGWFTDLSSVFPTMSDALDHPEVGHIAQTQEFPQLGRLDEVLRESLYVYRSDAPYLLTPIDWHVIKACGVTFIRSLLERLIEERTHGDQTRASSVREDIVLSVMRQLEGVVPGSESAEALKAELQTSGLWSQYLEVAIGRHAEVFTKGPVLSSVGFGQQVGIRRDSEWNNPEPELALLMNSRNEIVGATLANDVNLRDFEGRSALLLGEAKDFEASCSLGPAIRLFGQPKDFTLDSLMSSTIRLSIQGSDGFELAAVSDLSLMTRKPRELVRQAGEASRTYPDGYALLTGTMFAPKVDRFGQGLGFTHQPEDFVAIENPFLGTLVNWVEYSDEVPRWSMGARAFSSSLFARGLF